MKCFWIKARVNVQIFKCAADELLLKKRVDILGLRPKYPPKAIRFRELLVTAVLLNNQPYVGWHAG